YLGQAGLVVSILVGLTSIAVAFNRIYTNYSSQKYKKVELYRQLQKLCGTDASANLPEILVILHLFTRAHLTNKEIEWFIWTPGAFRYLSEYGRKIELVDIDYGNDTFKWRGKLSDGLRRLGCIAVLSILYFVTGVVGIVLYQLAYKYFSLDSFLSVIITIISVIAGSIFLIMAYRFLNKVLILFPPEYLVGVKLLGDRRIEEQVEVAIAPKDKKRDVIFMCKY
ncbi:hypothetical protein, partial [Pseudoalteromonas sp. SW0106-04]|uniref:hypothetical protein n=1 Tax=Pseudoalteromonas sp. SW0106-04 TaxID=1702169 RepID=UPI0006B4843B